MKTQHEVLKEQQVVDTHFVQNCLPATGYVRVSQICGDKKRGIWPPIIPVSKSDWWAGVKEGRYPAPIKLSERVTVWNADDLRSLLAGV